MVSRECEWALAAVCVKQVKLIRAGVVASRRNEVDLQARHAAACSEIAPTRLNTLQVGMPAFVECTTLAAIVRLIRVAQGGEADVRAFVAQPALPHYLPLVNILTKKIVLDSLCRTMAESPGAAQPAGGRPKRGLQGLLEKKHLANMQQKVQAQAQSAQEEIQEQQVCGQITLICH